MLIKMFRQILSRFFLILILTIVTLVAWQEEGNAQTACRFAPTSEISSVEQAKCLLRQPKIFGNVESTLTSLPSPLDRLLSQPTIDLDKETLRRYLKGQGIREADLGGSLDERVSRANDDNPGAEMARYFIIHDTSTPNFQTKPFPTDINEATWKFNNFNNYGSGDKAPAHIIINRLGDSVTRKNFNIPWRSTKFESDRNCGVNKCKGLFLGVELVQPRRSSPPGTSGNDALAPTPGFTDAQLDRLALVYIAASVRRGKWLIPAFHVVVDIGVGDHDDPQNFDLEQWAKRLNSLLVTIRS